MCFSDLRFVSARGFDRRERVFECDELRPTAELVYGPVKRPRLGWMCEALAFRTDVRLQESLITVVRTDFPLVEKLRIDRRGRLGLDRGAVEDLRAGGGRGQEREGGDDENGDLLHLLDLLAKEAGKIGIKKCRRQ